MTLRAMEGFETRQTTSFLGRLYTTTGTLAGVGTGRRQGTSASGSVLLCISRALVGAVEATWIIQFAFRKTESNAVSTNAPGISIRNSAGVQLEARVVDAATPDAGMFMIQIMRGATVLATSPIYSYGSTPQAWHVFQLKATIHTSMGAYEMKHWDYAGVETTAVAAATGANTANQGTNGADRFSFSLGVGGVSTVELDDIVVMDGSGSVNNNFTADPVVVLGERPSVDGATTDWLPSSGTNHAALVDDAPTSSAESGEVSSSDTGDVDLYTFTTTQLALVPTASPPTPLGVQVDVEANVKNSGTATLRVEVRDGADQATDGTDLDFEGSAKVSEVAVMEQNPTGVPAAWSMADLLSIQFGVRYQA